MLRIQLFHNTPFQITYIRRMERKLLFNILTLCTFCFLPQAMDAQGIFTAEQKVKSILIPTSSDAINNNATGADGSITFDRISNGTEVLPTLYGNNASSWMGKKILTDDVRKGHLKKLGISFMRFPGGNLSNNYFWDGNIPASTKQDNKYNPTSGTDNAWRLSVDDFLRLCDTLNNVPVLCVNASFARYGDSPNALSEAAHYAANFVRYINTTKGRNVRYWEIGNENYGKWQAGYLVAGDTINGTKYAEIVKVFSDSMKAADPTIKVGAVVVEEDAETGGGFNWWNRDVMPNCIDKADFWITHQYFVYDNLDWNNITTDEILNSTHLVKESIDNVHSSVAKYTSHPADYLPVAMTEFNLRGGTKEVSQVAALFLADCLGKFIDNKYGMVMLWDIQNGTKNPSSDGPGGDHGIYSWNDAILPNGTPRPSFFVYYYFQKVMGNKSSNVQVVGDSLISYASIDDAGNSGIVVINQSNNSKNITIKPADNSTGNYYRYSIHADSKTNKKFKINQQQNNTYSEGGPENYESILPYSITTVSQANITLEPNSVSFFIFESGTVTNTSIRQEQLNEVFPNPTKGVVNWTTPSYYEVYSMDGKLLEKGTGTSVDIQKYASGQYQIKIDGVLHQINKQ